MRHWYYADGGIYLSTQARKRYEHLQLVLEAILACPESEVAGHYEALMEAASHFPHGLAQDLATRANTVQLRSQRCSLVACLVLDG